MDTSKVKNFEVKARSFSNEVLEQKLIELGASYKGLDHQIDSYFNVESGRLKLRQGNVENSLIYYERSNDKNARLSDIAYEKLSSENNIKSVLSRALGVKAVVDKKRKIYFLDNVKVHFDYLDGLGEFVEIEAIDVDQSIEVSKLKEQCEYLIDKFSIKKKDFIKYSYSDLIKENFKQCFYREALEFLDLAYSELTQVIALDSPFIDHLCYRVTSEQEYKRYFNELSKHGELLIESMIGGRLIATFKLKEAILYNSHEIDVIELPMPKPENKYALGFEHLEIVIEESFEAFMKKNDSLKYDLSGSSKSFNSDIRVLFESGASVKFHHMSLEKVIEYEKSGSC